ncbi:outer membrane beta-barrel protein [Emcibacter sp. SYSU 3D8]|uniref:outer membrane beta-barrel protein n=1 Tax=Emcibacter sp. SYSU 3D8 TaxID=3133969 RepID=UPI0031FEA6CE
MAVSACAAASTAAQPAWAQLANNQHGNTVLTTPGPYDPIGFRAGPIYFFPSVSVQGIYNDNIYAEETGKRSDEILVVRPELQVQTDWSRHELQLYAMGEFGLYEDFTDEDYQDYLFQGRFRLDVSRATNLMFEASHGRDHQQRGDPEEVEGLHPTEYDATNAKVQVNQSLGRLMLSGGGSFRRLDFSDVEAVGGGFINNDDRDRDIYVANAKAAFEFSPGYSVYTEFSYNWRDFDDLVDDLGIDRDSEGFEINAGLTFELTNLIQGSIYGGYMQQNPDDPSLSKLKGPAFGASLDWNVTPRTTVGLKGQRTIEDSQFVNSAGYFADRGRLSVDHKVRENLILSVFGEIGQDDYRGIARNDFRYGVGGRIEWRLNRHLAADVAYSYQGRDSNFAFVEDFNQNRVSVSLKARY